MTTTNDTSAKGMALRAIESLPDDAAFDDIYYTLYVVQQIKRGLDDIEAGRTVSHDEVVQSMQQWLK